MLTGSAQRGENGLGLTVNRRTENSRCIKVVVGTSRLEYRDVLGRFEEAAPIYRRFIAVAPPSMDLQVRQAMQRLRDATRGR